MGRKRVKPDNEQLRDFFANVGPMDERRADAILEREKALIQAGWSDNERASRDTSDTTSDTLPVISMADLAQRRRGGTSGNY